MNKHISTSLLFLLAAVSALSPFAIDSYLSAIPIIAAELNSDIAFVSVTVSIYIFGLAIGQLIGGPLSDRFGRLPIIGLGLFLFGLGSMLIAMTTSIETLWLYRIIQAIGGGISIVGIPAIIRDHTQGKESARLFSLIMLISMIAPSIAPSFGTLVLKTLGWHWIFILMAGFGVLLGLLAFKMNLKNHNNKPKEAAKEKHLGGYAAVLKQRQYMGFLLAQAFGFAMLMTFLANAPFAYIKHFDVTEEMFSALLILNVVGVVTVNRLNNRLLNKYEPAALLKAFTFMQLLAVVVLLLVTLFMPQSLLLTVAALVLVTSPIGGIMPNSSASFMNGFAKNAGTAAAALGTAQYVIGALVSACAALFSQDSLWAIVGMMLLATCISFAGAAYSKSATSTAKPPAIGHEPELDAV
ncbi:Bcr/CflA family efflux MFS transporter [Shewanella sp. 10N.286.48.A6]|uniref:Bcr/CflA family efflux MFS transporter n=1 Tax=Shewanella sp. 10N.286.48.A6 TaxID=1880833 RepID=UPI000C81FA2C|nr:Bcr/CflA family efflux MFS transporter [Shewanella sp. 10N.286.48.A6]PMH97065.1 hypothetical protein BCU55_18955 [Shewanella sp. 10N.286.48.A6]